jgi:hypothetical protein
MRWLAVVRAVVTGLGLMSVAGATVYNLKVPMPDNLTHTWDETAIWQEGVVPGAADTAVLDVNNENRWWTVQTRTGGGAGVTIGTVNLIDNNNTQPKLDVNYTSGSTIIGIINSTRTDAHAWGGLMLQLTNALTLTQYNELDKHNRDILGSGTLSFTGAAQITYAPVGDLSLTKFVRFNNATSVNLTRNSYAGQPWTETITIDNPIGWAELPLVIGRSDNGDQNWTVGPTSNPVIRVWDDRSGLMTQVVGSGNVYAPGVSFLMNPSENGSPQQYIVIGGTTYQGTGITSTGKFLTTTDNLFPGTLTLKSLTVSNAGASSSYEHRMFFLGGNTVLAGANASGHALQLTADQRDMILHLGRPAAAGNANNALLAPITVHAGAGDIYLSGTANGKASIRIWAKDAQKTSPSLTADVIHLGPYSFITDRDFVNSYSGGGGGMVLFRKDFIVEGNVSTDMSLDHTTVIKFGNGTFEMLSADNGLAGPGASNYLIDKLVIGRDATEELLRSVLGMVDTYDNSTGVTPEALYVNSLELYASSTLNLNDLPLYYKNSGSWQLLGHGLFAGGDGSGFVFIPEPGAGVLALLLAGGGALRRRRRG